MIVLQTFPPDRLTEVQASLSIIAGMDRWRFETRQMRRYDQENGVDRFVRVTRNGREIWKEQAGLDAPHHLPFGFFFKFSHVEIKSRWPVVAIRGHSGIGFHQDTLLFAIIKGKLVRLGRPPSPNSQGPVNYQGRKDLWLLDDFDVYEHKSTKSAGPPLRYVLYRVTARGMQRLRSWKPSKGVRLKDTIKLNDW
jgi:hypothetical protein